jgi:prevent-host-death family protein
MEVNAKEVKSRISELLNRFQKGEEIILTRWGRKVARVVSFETKKKRLPDFDQFRKSIPVKGLPVSEILIKAHDEERY